MQFSSEKANSSINGEDVSRLVASIDLNAVRNLKHVFKFF